MYEVLRDYTHPITGGKMYAGQKVYLSCRTAINMLLKLKVIKAVGASN